MVNSVPKAMALLAAAVACLVGARLARADIIGEHFEDQSLGSFPSDGWQDIGAVGPDAAQNPDPSATVESTTDAFGDATQALRTVPAIAPIQGIYRSVPLSPRYVVSADVRIDQLSDNPSIPASEWAMQMGFSHFSEDINPLFWSQVGIYASSLEQGWRVFVAVPNAFSDIDLGLAVTLGVWYRLQLEIEAATGVIRSRIWDTATGMLLVDDSQVIDGWTAEDGAFDVLTFFDGELSEQATIPNIAFVDHICAMPTPNPVGDLTLDGHVDAADLAILLGSWGPCDGCPADLNSDGTVGAADLALLLSNWG